MDHRNDRPPHVATLGSARLGVLAVSILAASLASQGCKSPPAPHVPLSRRSSQIVPDSIPDRPPSGKIAGTAFRFREARWRVDRRPGRERFEVWLSEARLPRCGLPGHDRGRRVWFRIPQKTDPETGEWRVDPGQRNAPISVHYEVPEEHRWTGRQGGAALLRIDRVADLGEIFGRVDVCFDDGLRSCVAGRFRATPCVSRVDGHAIRELPVGGSAERWRPEGDE